MKLKVLSMSNSVIYCITQKKMFTILNTTPPNTRYISWKVDYVVTFQKWLQPAFRFGQLVKSYITSTTVLQQNNLIRWKQTHQSEKNCVVRQPMLWHTCKCLTMFTTSRVEYGYDIRPWSAIVRSSPNARTSRRSVSSGTSGPYCCNIDISDAMSGLSTAWQLNISPGIQWSPKSETEKIVNIYSKQKYI